MFDTFNLLAEIHRFVILKMFYPPERLCESRTQCGPFDALPLYCGYRRVFDTFNLQKEIRRFEILILFYLLMGWDGMD